ncbi:MAG: hypothetical protein JJ974_12730 [Phycisphaerales bacterium]|nr:hypothetical protein [Phycisphaerales bacterium]
MNTAAAQLLRTLLILTTLIILTGCGTTKYKGKVIPGTVGRPLVIDQSDDRINNNPGIPGLTVTVYNESRSGQAPKQITKATTDEAGNFMFSIPSKETPRGAVVVRVTGDEIYSARAKTYLPRSGQIMLYTVVTREPFLETDPINPEK